MSNTFCVICAREPEHGYLCPDCYSRLASMLREIEDETAILDAVPSMAIRSGEGGGGTLASHRAPANLDVLVATDPRRGTGRIGYDDADPWGIDNTASVLETLHSRARTVREEGPFAGPEIITVSGEREFLTIKLDWCARQPWIDEMYQEIRELLAQLQRSNKTQPTRHEGFCPAIRNESICGGRIWRREHKRFVWRIKGDRCERERIEVNDGEAYCERCAATWDGLELKRLNLILEKQHEEDSRPRTENGQPMLTAREMADKLRITVGTFRVRATRRGIRAVLGHYDPDAFADESGTESVA